MNNFEQALAATAFLQHGQSDEEVEFRTGMNLMEIIGLRAFAASEPIHLIKHYRQAPSIVAQER
ncbi:MAG: hypothetical protein ACYDD1_11160 [Caulobacteraceae bacterium]